jgi:hypothetical protein
MGGVRDTQPRSSNAALDAIRPRVASEIRRDRDGQCGSHSCFLPFQSPHSEPARNLPLPHPVHVRSSQRRWPTALFAHEPSIGSGNLPESSAAWGGALDYRSSRADLTMRIYYLSNSVMGCHPDRSALHTPVPGRGRMKYMQAATFWRIQPSLAR